MLILQLIPQSRHCNLCGAKPNGVKKYIIHMSKCQRKRSRKKYVPLEQIFKCKYCRKEFDQHLYLEYHLAAVHNCIHCSKSVKDLEKHLMQHKQSGGSIKSQL